MCQFSSFCYPKVKENKMKLWKRHVLTTHTVCKHCGLICYETDMGPEIPTAAADQNFAWICKQHQDLIGSVLIFRTKIIWSGPEFGLVRCGYLNTANVTSHTTSTYNMADANVEQRDSLIATPTFKSNTGDQRYARKIICHGWLVRIEYRKISSSGSLFGITGKV